LRRGPNIREAIGISVALMAPSMAANINPQATAGSVGRAVPLAFALPRSGVARRAGERPTAEEGLAEHVR
jgi:hypothetical protein